MRLQMGFVLTMVCSLLVLGCATKHEGSKPNETVFDSRVAELIVTDDTLSLDRVFVVDQESLDQLPRTTRTRLEEQLDLNANGWIAMDVVSSNYEYPGTWEETKGGTINRSHLLLMFQVDSEGITRTLEVTCSYGDLWGMNQTIQLDWDKNEWKERVVETIRQ